MSFLSVLKKIGTVVVDAAGIVSGLGPLLPLTSGSKTASVVSTATNDLTQIAGIVTTIETAFAAVSTASTGPLKLQAAAPLVSQVIQQSTMLAGHKIGDPAAFNQGVITLTNGVVAILNSLEPSNIGVDGSSGAQPVSALNPPVVVPPTP